MDLKIPILVIALILMAAIVFLSVAGLMWFTEAPRNLGTGGKLILSVAGVAALGGLTAIWANRHRATSR
jgi:hypothetical protein